MSIIGHLLREQKTFYYQLFANRSVEIRLERPIISFTFDDVPDSAFCHGLPILDRHEIKATFYVALGLSALPDGTDHTGYLLPDNIRALSAQGHDIACHTWSHYRLHDGTAEGMVADAGKNVRALGELLGPVPIEHFSYPFGQVNFRLKKKLAQQYRTMRSSRSGVNHGTADLNLLRATSIYDSTFSKDDLGKTINLAEKTGGWLIFYTHGVTAGPGEYDCTPQQLEWVVQQARQTGAHLLPVSRAYAAIMQSQKTG